MAFRRKRHSALPPVFPGMRRRSPLGRRPLPLRQGFRPPEKNLLRMERKESGDFHNQRKGGDNAHADDPPQKPVLPPMFLIAGNHSLLYGHPREARFQPGCNQDRHRSVLRPVRNDLSAAISPVPPPSEEHFPPIFQIFPHAYNPFLSVLILTCSVFSGTLNIKFYS